MNGLRQLRDAMGAHQVGWKSPTVDDETASQQHGEESQTGIEVQCRAELARYTRTASLKLMRSGARSQ